GCQCEGTKPDTEDTKVCPTRPPESKTDKPDCPKWKKSKAFKSNGRVDSSFCDEYARDERACKKALSNLQKRAKQLEKLEDQLDSLEEKQWESLLTSEDDSTTEASGVCFDCLKRTIIASQPTTGQILGKTLGLLAGTGLSIAGYKIGQSAQRNANMLRINQGYPALNDGFSLTGIGAGYPFMANGIYGLTRASTPTGGWVCTPTVNSHGHVYNHGHGFGHNVRYF
ncbi:MAG: hypothetical protein OXC37_06605, partial [Bdellovibrionaceae bacterium]|nr:hypothetical protein [Pseudobdellovibrionaceae bacterium]